jgi:hypothetical protein
LVPAWTAGTVIDVDLARGTLESGVATALAGSRDPIWLSLHVAVNFVGVL